MRINALLIAIFALISAASSGCGNRNVSQFNETPGPGVPAVDELGRVMTRSEVSDQGSGTATSTGITAQKTTIGGAYLRRFGASSGSYRFSGGVHAKPGP